MKILKILKIIAKVCLVLLALFVIAVLIITRMTGIGIKTHEGKFIGFSVQSQEWLMNEYRNFSVTEDGPYVFEKEGQMTALYIRKDQNNQSKLITHEVYEEVEVRTDSQVPVTFTVPLRNKYERSNLDIQLPENFLALSDFEGQFDEFVDMLAVANVVDESLEWTFGSGHLIIVGDMVDRGTNVLPLLWLIYKLEAEAIAAGGQVHYVLGNHERYLLDGRVKSAANKYQGTFRVTGMSPSDLWSENTVLGQWLRSKPVLLKVGHVLFVHGGVSKEVMSRGISLESVDEEAANGITLNNSIFRTKDNSAIHNSDGLLFYRGMAKDLTDKGYGEKVKESYVSEVLSHFHAKHIAIGHTLVEHIGYDYNGKVLRLDVNHAEGESEALLFKNNEFYRMDRLGDLFPLMQVVNLD